MWFEIMKNQLYTSDLFQPIMQWPFERWLRLFIRVKNKLSRLMGPFSGFLVVMFVEKDLKASYAWYGSNLCTKITQILLNIVTWKSETWINLTLIRELSSWVSQLKSITNFHCSRLIHSMLSLIVINSSFLNKFYT